MLIFLEEAFDGFFTLLAMLSLIVLAIIKFHALAKRLASCFHAVYRFLWEMVAQFACCGQFRAIAFVQALRALYSGLQSRAR